MSCCDKIILQKYESDSVDSLRDMDNEPEHTPASMYSDEYIHMYNVHDVRWSETIVCLSLLGLKAHVVSIYQFSSLWPRAQGH